MRASHQLTLRRQLDQFDQDPAGRPRVDEGDHAVRSRTGLPIDQFVPFFYQVAHLRADVVDQQTNVMEALTTTLQKAGNTGGIVERLDELDLGVAPGKHRYFDVLIRDLQPVDTAGPEQGGVARNRLVEIRDHDGRVVNPLDVHAD